MLFLLAIAGCGRFGFDPTNGDDVVGGFVGARGLVSTNGDHSCAIHAGHVVCWGGNDYGDLGTGNLDPSFTPVTVTGFTGTPVLVATGEAHTCILTNGGQVWCWGNYEYGQIGAFATGHNVPFEHPIANLVLGLPPNPVELVAGDWHNCVRYADGTAWCWGKDDSGQLGDSNPRPTVDIPVQVIGLVGAVELSAGGDTTCARLADGRVHCWGYNNAGQVGDNSMIDRSVPVDVAGIDDASAIGVGQEHACAIVGNGAIRCWGSNSADQLGIDGASNTLTPGPAWGSSFVAIDAGTYHTCGIAASGAVACWGTNTDGSLGTNAFADAPTATTVAALANVRGISAGRTTTCAIQADASVACWGLDDRGQLGNGRGASTQPQHVALTASSVTGDQDHTCAITGPDVSCWGDNDYGKLGDGTENARSVPTPVAKPWSGTVAKVATGTHHTCALLTDGSAWCWGSNNYGELGDGTTDSSSTPVAVIGLGNAVEIGAGDYFTCARKSDLTVWCWGYNRAGQLGDSTTNSSMVPVQAAVANAAELAVGDTHVCIRAGTTAICWGDNYNGQLGIGSTTAAPPTTIPGLAIETIKAGAVHTCALESGTHAVWCWGYNLWGQLGINDSADRSSPVSIGVTNATLLAAGVHGTCAFDGALECWGANDTGQLGDGTFNGRNAPSTSPSVGLVTSIAIGEHHLCYSNASGEVYCTGGNIEGELGIGYETRSATPVAVPLP